MIDRFLFDGSIFGHGPSVVHRTTLRIFGVPLFSLHIFLFANYGHKINLFIVNVTTIFIKQCYKNNT